MTDKDMDCEECNNSGELWAGYSCPECENDLND